MAKQIQFLNSGYVTLTPAVVSQIAALNGKGVEIKFGYAMGANVALVTEATSESLERLAADPAKNYKHKPVSVRGWEFEAKDASSSRKTSK
jgi:hypothetical protein